MPAKPFIPAYRHSGALLVRASTYPDGARLPHPPDPHDAVEDTAGGRAWLADMWQHHEVRQVVHAASPVLHERIGAAVTGGSDPRSIRRLVRSLALYVVRWRGRATPFGLFAGVAPARVGQHALVRWTDQHRVVARPDALWLDAVISGLEAHPGLLDRLPVVANGAAFVRGAWLIVHGQPPVGRPGAFAPLEIAVRRTGPVRAVVDAASEPLVLADLVKQLTAAYPTVVADQIRALLAGLVARGVLLTSLRAPMTVPDPLAHLLAEVEAVNAGELAEVAGPVDELRGIHAALGVHNTLTSAEAHTARARLTERMRDLADVPVTPLLLDVAVGCEITLPAVVIAEAEAAVGTLLRLTPYPFGYPHWKDFHTRFRRRFGPGAVVMVRDLLADSGLGLPAGYLGAPTRPTQRTLTARDETLIALVQRATMDRTIEIVLDDQLLHTLAVDPEADLDAPPRVELAFQVHAASVDDVQRGRFRLVVTGVPRPASSMGGRFVDLLPSADADRWVDSYRTIGGDVDAIAAQLSFSSRQRRDDNVIRTPRLVPHVLSLAEHRSSGDGLLVLDDLAVYADARHMHLIQVSTGSRVEVRVPHALEGGIHTPPLARFLAEVSGARRAAYTAFEWGAAARMPFLPRLRSGRTVLCPARWLLRAADLPRSDTPSAGWEAAFDVWRQRWLVPALVAVCEGDQRLPLDLHQPVHRALLRARLDRAGLLELREAPTPADLGWLGRAHEFLLPLHAVDRRAGQSRQSTGRPARVVPRDAANLPGRSRVLYARLHGHPLRQDQILAALAPHLITGWDDARLWWFSRYRDQAHPDLEQRLDLWVRLPAPDRYGPAAARLAAWAADLRDQGLLSELNLATYQPQTGRYGHGPALAAAEDVFAADSAAAIAEIAHAADTGGTLEAVVAASLVDLATSYAPTPDDGQHWLIDHLPHEPAPVDRAVRDEALRLADPRHTWPDGNAVPTISAAWRRRRDALASYRDQLAAQREPLPVLRSLLHHHHVRAIGVDPDRERVTHRLARAAALRHTARRRDKAR